MISGLRILKKQPCFICLSCSLSASAAASPQNDSPQKTQLGFAENRENDSESVLSVRPQDKALARRMLPFDADVQLVRSSEVSSEIQAIGIEKGDVWAFEVATQVSQIRRIGKLFLPDSKMLSRIEGTISGSKIIVAFQNQTHDLPIENPWNDLVSRSQGYTAFVQAEPNLYKVSFTALEEPVVQCLGILRN